jgi:hypothetical protein
VIDGGSIISDLVAATNQSALTLDRGRITGQVELSQNSAMTANGGEIDGRVKLMDSELTLSGDVRWDVGWDLEAAGRSVVNALGGELIGPETILRDQAMLHVREGGHISPNYGTRAEGDSQVIVSGGHLFGCNRNDFTGTGLLLTDRAYAQLSAGIIACSDGDAGVKLTGNATFDLMGGSIRANEPERPFRPVPVDASGRSHVRIYGGELTVNCCEQIPDESPRPHLLASEEATISIYGTSFNFPLNEPISLNEGVISGTLLDGSDIEWGFRREDQAVILLVPEPPSLSLALLGGLMPVTWRRRRHVACRYWPTFG